MPKLLTSPQAARILGCTDAWLCTLRKTGKGPPYQQIGARYFYHPSTLRHWQERRDEKRATAAADKLDRSVIREHLGRCEQALADLRLALDA